MREFVQKVEPLVGRRASGQAHTPHEESSEAERSFCSARLESTVFDIARLKNDLFRIFSIFLSPKVRGE